MIDNQLIDKILNQANIVDVIGDYVTLNKKGVNYWGVCPFHSDRSPSLCVSAAKQIFKCFTCGEGGNAVGFLEKHEHMSFPEAIRYLGKKYDIEVPDEQITPEDRERIKERESITIVLKSANDIFQKSLLSVKEPQYYLNNRGWDTVDPVLELFSAGYAKNEWKYLTTELLQKTFTKEALVSSGLTGDGQRGLYDIFRGRITFPYFDLKGNIIGFTGRLIHPDEKAGKYLNTGDTPAFKKGSVIFGLFQAKQAIAQTDKVFFVEGQFDVLSMVKAGIRNTVCGSGTALTPEQIHMILRFTCNITLIYDQDPAGVKASVRNIKELLLAGANVRAVILPDGEDPDTFARNMKENELKMYLHNRELDWVTYLYEVFKKDLEDPVLKNETLTFVCECIAAVRDKALRITYTTKCSDLFRTDIDIVKEKIREVKASLPENETEMKPGFYGIEMLAETLRDINDTCIITDHFGVFRKSYGLSPVIYFTGSPGSDRIQELRRHTTCLEYIGKPGSIFFCERSESDQLATLRKLFQAGLTVYVRGEEEKNYEFVDYYLRLYSNAMVDKTGDIRTIYTDRCAEVISYASEAAQSVMEKEWRSILHLSAKSFNNLLKPYREKRKSTYARQQQRSFDDTLMFDDPDILPDYVEENDEYRWIYRRFGFYPLLNREKEPVGYMFKNTGGNGHRQVADFYMIPLLHIYDKNRVSTKRVVRINRRYYKQPLYLDIENKYLASLQSFEEILLNEEGLNFENGDIKHLKTIRQVMSYNYIKCQELRTYGQQPENFYAFSNAIFHEEDGVYKIQMVSDMGVAAHKGVNYYAPAFSKINAGMRNDDDPYEQLRHFIFKEIPEKKRCTFDEWASLMDRVYKINDNGKWALIYSVMCAFRSDIHAIDRLFTALFFMGPTMSGKTQVAISIRSLYVSPDAPSFNLNSGTDAAFFTLMEGFRDVPQVLEEYNNKDISDAKFQGLKSVTYDGDGKQKRKGTSGKEIEVSKVYSPVVILGQETPQKDDNALMNRVVICEVPKKDGFTEEEKAIYQELKEHEKTGLCNILFEVLKLRPIVREHFKKLQRTINRELTTQVMEGSNKSGDMVRIINTVSLFLAMCKLIEDYAPQLKLPFTYETFFSLAVRKIISQVEMISHTDKLAIFFKAVEVMINTKSIIEGRDYAIDQPEKLTLKMPGNERREITLTPAHTKVLYLRLSIIHTLFAKSSFNSEDATLSTIESNIRSNPSYIGVVNSRRFRWKEVKEVPKGDLKGGDVNMEMVRIMEDKSTTTSCIAMNYDLFRKYFDIDLERSNPDSESDQSKTEQQPIPPHKDLPF